MTKTRQDNDVTDRIVVVYVENDTKLRDRWDRVLTMMKTRQDNNVTNRTNAVYVTNETKLL